MCPAYAKLALRVRMLNERSTQMHTLDRSARRRVDASRNRRRIIEAATRLFQQSPSATLADIAPAAGVSRSTLYRNFRDRQELIGAIDDHSDEIDLGKADDSLPAGRLGRKRPVPLEAIDVFDAVPPPVLPDQLVAEAQRIANVVLALYVVDIDGSIFLSVR